MNDEDYLKHYVVLGTYWGIRNKLSNLHQKDSLTHWAKKNHKYVARIPIGNKKYRYFYSMEDFRKYKEGRDKIKAQKKIRDSNSLITGRSKFKDVKNDGRSKFRLKQIANEELANALKSKPGESTKIQKGGFKRRTKYVAKVKLDNGKYRYFYSAAEYLAYLKRKEYQDNEPDFMKDIPELSAETSWENMMGMINGDRYTTDYVNLRMYGKDPSEITAVSSHTNNCMLCTTAYELVQRGYNVTASGMNTNIINLATTSGLSSLYKDPKIIKYDAKVDPHTLLAPDLKGFILKNNPPNSRGNLMVGWLGGGAHSIAYEVDSRNNVRLVDAQIGKAYTSDKSIDKIRYSVDPSRISICRTDNLELNEGVLDAIDFEGKYTSRGN